MTSSFVFASATRLPAVPHGLRAATRWLDRAVVAPVAIALLTTLLFHAVVGMTRPEYWSKAASWDESYYVQIAVKGYELPGGDYARYSALPFSPAMGLLLRACGWITGVPPVMLRAPLGALLFSIGLPLLGWALAAFSANVRRNNLALLLFALWPGSLYFRTGYAEALYLPLLAAFFGFLLRQRWAGAALLAAACCFTRTPAIVLVGTLGVAIVLDAFATRSLWSALGQSALRLAWAMPIAVLGLVGYMLMLRAEIGDPWAFRKAYVAWNPCELLEPRSLEGRTIVDALAYRNAATLPLSIATFLALPLVVWTQRRAMPAVLTIFAAGAWLFFLSQDWVHDPFHDMLRWTAVVFPMHYALALAFERLPRGVRSTAIGLWLAASAAAFVWCVHRFVLVEWVS